MALPHPIQTLRNTFHLWKHQKSEKWYFDPLCRPTRNTPIAGLRGHLIAPESPESHLSRTPTLIFLAALVAELEGVLWGELQDPKTYLGEYCTDRVV